MSGSPIIQTMDEMFGKLTAAILTRAEAERQIAEYTNALKALAKVIEDKDTGDGYLVRLDELTGKPGFTDAIRTVLRISRTSKKGLTPREVRTWIQMGKKMDLSLYSNPMASIHTTLRRMEESGEIESFTNERGEKAYRHVARTGLITPPPRPDETIISPPEPVSLAAIIADERLPQPQEAPLNKRSKTP